MLRRLLIAPLTGLLLLLMALPAYALSVNLTLNAANIQPGCKLISLSVDITLAGPPPTPGSGNFYSAVGYDSSGKAIGFVSYSEVQAIAMMTGSGPATIGNMAAQLPAGDVTVRLFENAADPADAATAATGTLIGSFTFNPADILADCAAAPAPAPAVPVWEPDDDRIGVDAATTINTFYEDQSFSIYSVHAGSISTTAACDESTSGTVLASNGSLSIECLIEGMFMALEHEDGNDDGRLEFMIVRTADGEVEAWRRGYVYPDFVNPADSWWEIYREDGDWTGYPMRSPNAP